jgi:hypothetical protein
MLVKIISILQRKDLMTVCSKCGHGMILHGCVDGVGYCMEGNGDWCECTVKGKTYEEEIESIKHGR